MEAERSEAEQAFIERFKLENAAVEEVPVDEEAVQEAKARRGAFVFWGFIVFLILCPFVLSSFFLYTLARYESLIGPSGLEVLNKTLSSAEVQQMGQETGLPELELFVAAHDNRHVIVALIFTFFLVLAAILIALRGTITYLRTRSHG